jgi:hypothetical protein
MQELMGWMILMFILSFWIDWDRTSPDNSERELLWFFWEND